jgi:hypothetical protein
LSAARREERHGEHRREREPGDDRLLGLRHARPHVRRLVGGRAGEPVEGHVDDADLVAARRVGADGVAHERVEAGQLHRGARHRLGRRPRAQLVVHEHRHAQAAHVADGAAERLGALRGLVARGDVGARRAALRARRDLGALLGRDGLLVGVDRVDAALDLVEVDVRGHLDARVAHAHHLRDDLLRLLLEVALDLALHGELPARELGARAVGVEREQAPGVVDDGHALAPQPVDARRDEVGDAAHHVGGGALAVRELEHHARLHRPVLPAEEGRLAHRQVHLRLLDAAHLADRALELPLERAAVVDALREVGHPPRRLVEQLEPGAARVGQPAVAGERHARPGQVVGLHGQLGAALLEVVLDPGLGELVGQLAGLFDGDVAERRHPGGLRRPARDAEDQPRGEEADQQDERAARPADAVDQGRERLERGGEGEHGGRRGGVPLAAGRARRGTRVRQGTSRKSTRRTAVFRPLKSLWFSDLTAFRSDSACLALRACRQELPRRSPAAGGANCRPGRCR